MLKKSTYILLSLLLCIPLVFIIYFSTAIDTDKPTSYSLIGLSVTDRDGHEFSFGDQEDLEVYLSAVSRAKKTDKPSRDLNSETPAIVTHTEKQGEFSYRYYMSLDANECYYTDSKGGVYHLSEKDAETLAKREEFSYLYGNYTLPTLTLSSSEKDYVLGAGEGAEWHFKRGDDFAEGYISNTENTGVVLFGKNDALNIDFAVAPTICDVTVYNGSVALHSAKWASYDDTETLSEKLFSQLGGKISYENDTPLVCEINAEWVNSDSSSFYGKASYRADLMFDVPVTCASVDAKLSPGEFTFVKLYNLNEGQTVTMMSDSEDFPFPETRVHKIGDMTFAFLPVDLSTKPGTYNVTVIAGGDEESSFKITINNKSFSSSTVEQIHDRAMYDSSKAEFESLIGRLTAQSANEHFWKDAAVAGASNKYKFVNPVSGASLGSPSFGTRITEDPNLLSSTPYIKTGVALEAAAGTNVCATASGSVIYVGELGYPGKFVIIDHGFGMLSIYENLSEISVEQGANVTMGSVIGKTGTTGYVFNAGTRFSISLEGVFINPTTNYNYGISY